MLFLKILMIILFCIEFKQKYFFNNFYMTIVFNIFLID